MKRKTKIILGVLGVSLVGVLTFLVIRFYHNPTRLSIAERKWLDDNVTSIQNINILNDSPLFGTTGKGVFFDFISDFSHQYGLEINHVAFKTGDNPGGLTLSYGNTIGENDTVFYQDHYVLMARNYELWSASKSWQNKPIGILGSNLAHISAYLGQANLTFTSYETKANLITDLEAGTIEYILVPRFESLDLLLDYKLSVIKHFDDIPIYYLIKNCTNKLGSILSKYFLEWESNLNNYLTQTEFEYITTKLNISETEIDALRSRDYHYGFVSNSPYDIIAGGNYGGIVSIYLKQFALFAGVDLKFNKYRNFTKFSKAVTAGELDLYFNYYDLMTNYHNVNGGMALKYDVIAKLSNPIIVNSLNSLHNQEVYVLKNSLLQDYLTAANNLKVKTYQTNNELFKLARQGKVIVLDGNTYDWYRQTKLSQCSSRYRAYAPQEYSFKIKKKTAFYRLLVVYINLMSYEASVNQGILNYNTTIKSGTLMATIAKYFLVVLTFVLIAIYLIYRRTRQITISKKIKREDKMKYIDQLTSLKNRNYLNENIANWNNNKVYPQTMIVMDLNNIQHINDTLGYEEGDKQIKAVANILIKTQLDYSDIMRSDGNEFLVYLIGYSQKQVASYIHKLNKEFKKLPYNYGVEFGYSMITNDLKTIEDAINEAIEQMRQQKEAAKGASDEDQVK